MTPKINKFMICCPWNEKSLILPFNLAQATILPAKEIVPIINPAKMINKIPESETSPSFIKE